MSEIVHMKRYEKKRRWIHKIAHTQQIDYIGTESAIICTALQLPSQGNSLVDGTISAKIQTGYVK